MAFNDSMRFKVKIVRHVQKSILINTTIKKQVKIQTKFKRRVEL